MTKEELIEYCNLKKEINDLEKRIDKIHKTTEMVSDTVQNGYKHRAIIFGIDITRKRKISAYKAKLEDFYDKLLQEQNRIENYIETIPKSDVRQIFRYKYIDNMNWLQIMHQMKYKAESTARMKHDRFLEENL